jgi:hypothetical protein
MPKCTICTHEEREAIDHDLVAGKSYRSVALRFGVSTSAACRHRRDHIPADLARLAPGREQEPGELARRDRLAGQAEDQQAAAEARALDLLAELNRAFVRVRKLLDACDRWLSDPDEPDRYDLGPRADELLVHYTAAGPNGIPIRAKAPLSTLLARAARCSAGPGAADPSLFVDRVEFRRADPRELVLKAARRLEAELQLVARLVDRFAASDPDGDDEPLTGDEIAAMWRPVLDALGPYPEALTAVINELRRVSGLDPLDEIYTRALPPDADGAPGRPIWSLAQGER